MISSEALIKFFALNCVLFPGMACKTGQTTVSHGGRVESRSRDGLRKLSAVVATVMFVTVGWKMYESMKPVEYADDKFAQRLLHNWESLPSGSVKDGLVFLGNICEEVFRLAHDDLGHFGSKKSYASLNPDFCWPRMPTCLVVWFFGVTKVPRNVVPVRHARYQSRTSVAIIASQLTGSNHSRSMEVMIVWITIIDKVGSEIRRPMFLRGLSYSIAG